MNPETGVIAENVALLKQAQLLIKSLETRQFARKDIPPFNSGVGTHIRHVLDFFSAFLAEAGGRIDFDNRIRDPLIETDPAYACERIEQVIAAIEKTDDLERKVYAKNDDGGNRTLDQAFSRSSIGRELQFLASHTIHHFAMIAMVLARLGIPIPKDFGVAPSTLSHWRSQEANVPS